MGKRGIPALFLAVGVYFILYLTSTLFESALWGNILSPIGALISFSLLLRTYLQAKKGDYLRWIWLSFSMASLCWAIADVLWLIDEMFLGKDPETNMASIYFYFGTTLFLFLCLLIFAVKTFRRWNAIQLVVDSIAISISILFLFWILFFDKKVENLGMLVVDGWISAVTLTIDITIFVAIAVWYLSIRSGKIPVGLRFIAAFTVLFDGIDIFYYYLYMSNKYIPNSIIDALYMAALLGIALSVVVVTAAGLDKEFSVVTPLVDYSNIGYKQKGWILLLMPFLTLFRGFDASDLFVSFLIIFLHSGLCSYIQNSIHNENLLKREIAINLDLEERINERTRELLEKNQQLDFLSNQDTVTNLFNRRYFLRELDEKIRVLPPDETLSVVFIDVDRFKTINDSYGHYIGDHILIELARKLQCFADSKTLVARLGGDEFVIAFHGYYDLASAEKKALEIVNACSRPIQSGEFTFQVTLSAGISMYPLDAESSDMLMRNADMAMYQAKKVGCNKVVSFNEILKQTVRRKNTIEIALKKADFDKEFELHFQPQFTMPDRKMFGMEALLRWNCPGKGRISPAEFIPIAEETNWIIPIGEWVLMRAAEQISQWNRKYNTDLKMGINVSPKQLDQTDFSQHLSRILKEAGAEPEWIDVEITEGIALEGSYKITHMADLFKNSGISISIDDFGTGYSSLSYLKMYPFNRVKIDMSLIDTIAADKYDRQIVRSIILLASSIGMQCIAEGVETKAQFDILHELGCKQIQGFYLAKPLAAAEFEARFLAAESHKAIFDFTKMPVPAKESASFSL